MRLRLGPVAAARSGARLKAETSHSFLPPAEMVGKLVTQGPLYLAGKQVAVMAEVTLQGVAIDDDSILVAFARDTVSKVLAVSVYVGTEIGDHDRDVREYLLELVGQPINRIGDQGFELVELRGIGHGLQQ